MKQATDEFEAAVELFAHSNSLKGEDKKSKEILFQWRMIAGRIGALCLYDFWMATQGINKDLLPRCPTIRSLIDETPKNAAQAAFVNAFPTAAKLRYTAAHPAEVNATPEKAKANSVSGQGTIGGINVFDVGDDGSFNMQTGLINDQYATTFKGQLLSYALNHTSTLALRSAQEGWFKAFDPASEELRRRDIEQHLRTVRQQAEGQNRRQ